MKTEDYKYEQMEPLNYKRNNRVWTGLFLIGAGALLFAYQLGAPIPRWLISWPVALIAFGVLLNLRHRFRSVAGFILILVGGFNLLDQMRPEFNFRNYTLPVVIIAIGLFFILRPKKRWRHRQDWINDNKEEWKPNAAEIDYHPKYDAADYIDSTAILGGVKKVIVSKNFRGGDITCFMGGAEIDFTQADIQNTVLLDITAVFGGCKIIVPANWEVKSEATVAFGGIDDKRLVNAANLTPGKVLVLHGTVVFGGIDIRSY